MKQLWEGAAPGMLCGLTATSEWLLQPRQPQARPALVGSKRCCAEPAETQGSLLGFGAVPHRIRQPSPELVWGGESSCSMRHNPTVAPFLGWQNSRDLGAEPGNRVGKGVPSKGDSTHQPNWQGFHRQELEISCLQLLPGFFPI